MRRLLAVLATVALTISYAGVARPEAASAVALPFEKFVLENGLRVIVHEDRKAPVVAVSVWYHVGS